MSGSVGRRTFRHLSTSSRSFTTHLVRSVGYDASDRHPSRCKLACRSVSPFSNVWKSTESNRSRFDTFVHTLSSLATQSYRLNHTMFRVKDPEASLRFYQDILGMKLIDEHDGGDFKLFFLAYDHQKCDYRGEREGVLELTWNKGTENDSSFSYHNGNDQPQGFGHIAIAVDDVDAACQRFSDLGVKFKKRPEEGKMRHIAFIYDPDNYWIEIVPVTRKAH